LACCSSTRFICRVMCCSLCCAARICEPSCVACCLSDATLRPWSVASVCSSWKMWSVRFLSALFASKCVRHTWGERTRVRVSEARWLDGRETREREWVGEC
jgi:hypothetical protein